jgi:hypothetical protein
MLSLQRIEWSSMLRQSVASVLLCKLSGFVFGDTRLAHNHRQTTGLTCMLCVADGGLNMFTPIDPLFLILPQFPTCTKEVCTA